MNNFCLPCTGEGAPSKPTEVPQDVPRTICAMAAELCAEDVWQAAIRDSAQHGRLKHPHNAKLAASEPPAVMDAAMFRCSIGLHIAM